ncbi:AraC family transcriptional regulator [Sphingobacterium sp. T2]|uniref:helix-turn-helix domain-containing protein n=1 Tax=Sphingobacterium sp. T2 TaxID=1590596 RepID=UPI0018CCD810
MACALKLISVSQNSNSPYTGYRTKKFKKIGDISYALGYADQAYFNREFKFFSGYTPKEFMKVLAKQQFFYRTPEHTVIPLRILTD